MSIGCSLTMCVTSSPGSEPMSIGGSLMMYWLVPTSRLVAGEAASGHQTVNAMNRTATIITGAALGFAILMGWVPFLVHR